MRASWGLYWAIKDKEIINMYELFTVLVW
jgi:hypothetical protein